MTTREPRTAAERIGSDAAYCNLRTRARLAAEAAPPPAEAVEALDEAWQMQFAAMRRRYR